MDPADIKKIESLVNQLKRNKTEIAITDLGVGSKRMGSKRRISSIARNSSSNGKFGALLYKLSHHYKPQMILELGTSLGIGTVHMALGNPKALITTVEGCPETRAIAAGNFDMLGLSILSVQDSFEHFLETLESDQKYDLIFVDGHHDGKALLRYMKALQKFSHDDTIFILDDIRWSESMLEAWNTLKDSNDFHLSVDLFRMGILLKRPQQAKEEFSIRY